MLAGRRIDLFARVGGEEFVLLLPECNLSGARTKARNALELVKNMHIRCDYLVNGRELTVSIGVSVMTPMRNSSPASLFDSADKALYQVKNGGRNSYQLSTSTLKPV